MAALKGVCKGRWVMCGDFNLTKNLQKRRGRSWCGRLMSMFSDLLLKLGMFDLPLGNQNFTWSNMQSCPTIAKLDCFLISTKWDQAFPLSKVVAMPQITSDHSPILLTTGDKRPRSRLRFEDVWLSIEDFCSFVPTWWTEVPRKSSSNSLLLLN